MNGKLPLMHLPTHNLDVEQKKSPVWGASDRLNRQEQHQEHKTRKNSPWAISANKTHHTGSMTACGMPCVHFTATRKHAAQ
jgi:hypothetical protein